MAKRPMCPGSRYPLVVETNPTDYPTWAEADSGDRGARPKRIKRKRLKCPSCGRRLLSSVSTCHDGCCVLHFLPAHKSKGWWKRRKKFEEPVVVEEAQERSICPKCKKRHEPEEHCQWWMAHNA